MIHSFLNPWQSPFYCDEMNRRIDSHMWHAINSSAQTSPQAARLLAIPAALEIFAKDLLIAPGRIIETVFTSISFAAKIITLQTNRYERRYMSIDSQVMWMRSLEALLFLPISPLYAVADAITTLWLIISSPEKTGKIETARVETNPFIYKLLTTFEIGSKDTIYLPFIEKKTSCGIAPSCVGIGDFVRNAFDRFQREVSLTRNERDLAEQHFVDTEEGQERLKNEIVLKCAKISEAHQRGYLGERLKIVHDQSVTPEQQERAYEALNTLWLHFQEAVVRATPEGLEALKFEPSAEELLGR
jgi:hypothetical protein